MTKRQQRPGSNEREWLVLLLPGIGVKRWLGATALGVVLIGVGAFLALEYLSAFPQLATLSYWITLQYLAIWQRGLIVALLGLCLLFLGIVHLYGLTSTHILPNLRRPENRAMLENLIHRQRRSTGPKIVAIGGGTGMPQLLRGLRQYTDCLLYTSPSPRD